MGAFQLLATDSHSYAHLQPVPQVHQKMAHTIRTQVEEVAEISRSCLADKLNDFNNILDTLPQYEVITRDKRFLDLAALGMSAAALPLSTFNSAKISHLETQIVNNNKRVDHFT